MQENRKYNNSSRQKCLDYLNLLSNFRLKQKLRRTRKSKLIAGVDFAYGSILLSFAGRNANNLYYLKPLNTISEK